MENFKQNSRALSLEDNFLMLDFETLGLELPNPVVLTAGVSTFLNGAKSSYEGSFLLSEMVIKGFTVDPKTVSWHINTNGRETLQSLLSPSTPISISQFVSWISEDIKKLKEDADKRKKSFRLISGPRTFDIQILSHLFKISDVEKPWEFYEELCYHSVRDVSLVKKNFTTTHNAKKDAEDQMEHFLSMINFQQFMFSEYKKLLESQTDLKLQEALSKLNNSEEFSNVATDIKSIFKA